MACFCPPTRMMRMIKKKNPPCFPSGLGRGPAHPSSTLMCMPFRFQVGSGGLSTAGWGAGTCELRVSELPTFSAGEGSFLCARVFPPACRTGSSSPGCCEDSLMLVRLQARGAKWGSTLSLLVFTQFPSFLLCWLVTCLLYVCSHLKFNKTN